MTPHLLPKPCAKMTCLWRIGRSINKRGILNWWVAQLPVEDFQKPDHKGSKSNSSLLLSDFTFLFSRGLEHKMPQKPLRHEKTMRNLSSCLQLNRVYDSWRALAYPSLKPLGAWFQDGSGLGFWRIWMYHFNSYVVKGCKMIVLSKTP